KRSTHSASTRASAATSSTVWPARRRSCISRTLRLLVGRGMRGGGFGWAGGVGALAALPVAAAVAGAGVGALSPSAAGVLPPPSARTRWASCSKPTRASSIFTVKLPDFAPRRALKISASWSVVNPTRWSCCTNALPGRDTARAGPSARTVPSVPRSAGGCQSAAARYVAQLGDEAAACQQPHRPRLLHVDHHRVVGLSPADERHD